MKGVTFIYTNHRGEVARRSVVPLSIKFASNEYYPEPTWLLTCWDLDRKGRRTFAMSLIKFWEEDSRLKVICAAEACKHPVYEHYSVADRNGEKLNGCYDHHMSGSLESKCHCKGFVA